MMSPKKFFCTAASITVLLSGCGGGGSDTTSNSATITETTTPTATTPPSSVAAAKLTMVSGTAATGAPFSGATINITDTTGALVGTGTTDENGTYKITLAVNAAPPFVIQAARDDLTLTSVVPDASSSNINITPITTLIASRLSISGDPSKLAAEFQATPSLISIGNVNAKVKEVTLLLEPLFTAIGSAANPLTGTFSPNGTGMDRVLDSLSITFTPETHSSTNIEVAIRQKSAEGDQPNAIQFSSQAANLPQMSALSSSALVPDGTATLITDLLQRLTACYSLPFSDRVTTPDAANASASDIKASECKTLFVDNDPGGYLDNGQKIGGAEGSKPFNGIYRSDATGMKFERGTYQLTRENGDIVISFRTKDGIGGALDHTVVTRLSNTDHKLHIIGNQYAYPGSVSAYHQLRTYINQPAADNYSTGYALSVPNNGQFSKVIVTSPKGRQIALVPSSGSGGLVIPINNVPSTGGYVRIRGEFADLANTSNPANFEPVLSYDPQQASNDEIASFAAKSVWRFDYYLSGNSSGTPDTTQYYRTAARALTIPEIKQRNLASLTSDLINGIKARSANASSRFVLNNTDAFIPFSWTVPIGGVAPTQLRVFGQGPVSINGTRSRYDDSISVNSALRSGNILCQPQSFADIHCTQVGTGTAFADGSFVSSFDLVGTDAPGSTFSHVYLTYKILP